MSKDFETEYRQLADSEIPDLWDRIEAGLPEGAPAQENMPAHESESGQKTVSVEEKNAKSMSVVRFFNRRRTAALLTAAAAVLCILAIRPVTLHMKEQESMQGQYEGVTTPNEAHSDSFNNMADFIKDKFESDKSYGTSEDRQLNHAAVADEAWEAGEAANAETNFAQSDIQSSVSSDASGIKNGQTTAGDSANSEVNLAPMEQEDEDPEAPSEQDIAGAQAAAEAYYQETVFEVLSMEVKTAEEDRIVFLVQCKKGGKRVDPDRTIEVTFDGEKWEVTNEGY